jgi:hypothetical protein
MVVAVTPWSAGLAAVAVVGATVNVVPVTTAKPAITWSTLRKPIARRLRASVTSPSGSANLIESSLSAKVSVPTNYQEYPTEYGRA